jgi:hypothetical protein
MKRRRFIRISLFGSLLTPFFGQAESHPDLETIRGTFRTLTKPGHSDNRATFTPNGGTILFASKRTGKSYYHASLRDKSHSPLSIMRRKVIGPIQAGSL